MRTFINAISYKGRKCDVLYSHTDTFDGLPDNLILKAHAVCFCDNKILLVSHSEWNIWSIPGGTRDEDESIDQTLMREIQEETNCEVLDYEPISYQKVISPDGNTHYRLQYLCNVKPLGEFKTDSAGSVCKILWIDPEEFKEYIEKKEVREAVLQRAIEVYKSK
ncbi:MAG: NUDIX hydrolase [Candidatus Paceibacterota bacterium]|jgi:8-oxo-dGTP diphosphatase